MRNTHADCVPGCHSCRTLQLSDDARLCGADHGDGGVSARHSLQGSQGCTSCLDSAVAPALVQAAGFILSCEAAMQL
jgi:hypothetical protein